MINKNKLKEIKSLGQSKFRQKYNKFIAEGDKIANQFLISDAFKISEIYYTSHWSDSFPDLRQMHSDISTLIDSKTMSRITQLRNHSNILIIAEMKSADPVTMNLNDGYSIYLDDVQDPGNVGTIIRLADWFGFKSVIRSKGSADFYNPKVVQSTMGSMTGITLYTADQSVIINAEAPLYGALLEGTPIGKVSWQKSGILVMGNEGKGINPELIPHIDHKVLIKGSPSREAESLNVGIATGIICHQIFNAVLS